MSLFLKISLLLFEAIKGINDSASTVLGILRALHQDANWEVGNLVGPSKAEGGCRSEVNGEKNAVNKESIAG